MALLQSHSMSTVWLLSGVKRTKPRRVKIDVHDPQRYFATIDCRIAKGSGHFYLPSMLLATADEGDRCRPFAVHQMTAAK
jgi:hypothetical protein